MGAVGMETALVTTVSALVSRLTLESTAPYELVPLVNHGSV